MAGRVGTIRRSSGTCDPGRRTVYRTPFCPSYCCSSSRTSRGCCTGTSSIASSRSLTCRPLPFACASASIAPATTPWELVVQNTPSSNGRQFTFAAMFDTPRDSSTATTTTGNAGRDHRCQIGDSVIQRSESDIQSNELEMDAKKREVVTTSPQNVPCPQNQTVTPPVMRLGGRTTSSSSYTDPSKRSDRNRFLTPTSISQRAPVKFKKGISWLTCRSNLAPVSACREPASAYELFSL